MRRSSCFLLLASGAIACPSAVTGCGGEQPPPPPPDILSPCDLSKPFGPAYPVEGLDSVPFIGSPTFSPDELTIYVAPEQGRGGGQILTATRTSVDAPFGPLAPMSGDLGSPPSDFPWSQNLAQPTISADGLVIYLITWPMAYDHLQYMARATLSDPWQAPTGPSKYDVPVGGNVGVSSPFLELDGQEIFYGWEGTASPCCQPAGEYVSRWTGNGWGPSTFLADWGPTIASSDGLHAFMWLSVGPALARIGSASRASIDDSFGDATIVPELGADGMDDDPSWLSQDQCRLYFIRSDLNSGAFSLHVARHGR